MRDTHPRKYRKQNRYRYRYSALLSAVGVVGAVVALVVVAVVVFFCFKCADEHLIVVANYACGAGVGGWERGSCITRGA